MAVKVDINIGFMPQILCNPWLPVARIDKVNNPEGDIVDMFLIVLTEQAPALRGAAQAVNFTQRGFGRRRKSPTARRLTVAAHRPRATGQTHPASTDRRKEQEGGHNQDRLANAIRTTQGVLFMSLLTNVQQFNLLGLFTANGGLL